MEIYGRVSYQTLRICSLMDDFVPLTLENEIDFSHLFDQKSLWSLQHYLKRDLTLMSWLGLILGGFEVQLTSR